MSNDLLKLAAYILMCVIVIASSNLLWLVFRWYVLRKWARWLVMRHIGKPPGFIIGTPEDPYMHRWFVIPRNRWFNIYVHKIIRSDDPRALHDHPWINCSIVAFGGYGEILPNYYKVRRMGDVVFRWPTSAHRLQLIDGAPAYTVFITGPRVRVWGFLCPKGWVDYKTFTSPADYGQIGQGCGED